MRDTLPEGLFFIACRKTDLCNERWDRNYERWKAPRYNIGQTLASVDPALAHKTLIFWLDELLAVHPPHQCWQHLLDGACLWEQLSTGCNYYMFNVLWAMTLTVAAWLQNVSRKRSQQGSSCHLCLQRREASERLLQSHVRI